MTDIQKQITNLKTKKIAEKDGKMKKMMKH
jgi:hypothetical protein